MTQCALASSELELESTQLGHGQIQRCVCAAGTSPRPPLIGHRLLILNQYSAPFRQHSDETRATGGALVRCASSCSPRAGRGRAAGWDFRKAERGTMAVENAHWPQGSQRAVGVGHVRSLRKEANHGRRAESAAPCRRTCQGRAVAGGNQGCGGRTCHGWEFFGEAGSGIEPDRRSVLARVCILSTGRSCSFRPGSEPNP